MILIIMISVDFSQIWCKWKSNGDRLVSTKEDSQT